MKEACHVIRGAGQGTYADYALDACFLEGLPARSFVDALVVLPSTLWEDEIASLRRRDHEHLQPAEHILAAAFFPTLLFEHVRDAS